MPFHSIYDSVELDSLLRRYETRSLVLFFTADGCAASSYMEAFLREMSEKQNYTVLALDLMQEGVEEIFNKYHVDVMPTFIFFKSGAVVERYTGKDRTVLEEMCRKHNIPMTQDYRRRGSASVVMVDHASRRMSERTPSQMSDRRVSIKLNTDSSVEAQIK